MRCIVCLCPGGATNYASHRVASLFRRTVSRAQSPPTCHQIYRNSQPALQNHLGVPGVGGVYDCGCDCTYGHGCGWAADVAAAVASAAASAVAVAMAATAAAAVALQHACRTLKAPLRHPSCLPLTVLLRYRNGTNCYTPAASEQHQTM